MKTEDAQNAEKSKIRFESGIMILEPSAANARTATLDIHWIQNHANIPKKQSKMQLKHIIPASVGAGWQTFQHEQSKCLQLDKKTK